MPFDKDIILGTQPAPTAPAIVPALTTTPSPHLMAPGLPKTGLTQSDIWRIIIRPDTHYQASIQNMTPEMQDAYYAQQISFDNALADLEDILVKESSEEERQRIRDTKIGKIALEAERGVKGTFGWLAEQLDRPQDMVFAATLSLMEGEKDPHKIWERVNANRRGDDTTSFFQILDALPPNWQEDLVAVSGVLEKAMTQMAKGQAAAALGEIPEEWKEERDYRKNPLSLEEVRQFWGLVGEFGVDPLWAGGAVAGSVGKGLKGIKALQLAAKAAHRGRDIATGSKAAIGVARQARGLDVAEKVLTGLSPTTMLRLGAGKADPYLRKWKATKAAYKGTERILRDTFIRSPRNRDLAKVYEEMIDAAGYTNYLTAAQVEDAFKSAMKIKDWNVLKLAEESIGPKAMFSLFREIKAGKKSLKIFEPKTYKIPGQKKVRVRRPDFNNPQGLKEAYHMWEKIDEATELAVIKGVNDWRRLLTKLDDARTARGIVAAETFHERYRKVTKAKKSIVETSFNNLKDEVAKEIKAGEAAAEATIAAKERQLLELLSPTEYKQALQEYMSIDPKDLHKRFINLYGRERANRAVNYLEEAGSALEWAEVRSAQIVNDMADIVRGKATGTVTKAIRTRQKQLAKSINDFRKMQLGLAKLPNYVPHMMSKEAVSRYDEILKTAKGYGRSPADPTTVSDIHRQWVVEKTGRPLSFEEVEEVFKSGGLAWTKHGPIERTKADVFMQEGGILLRDGTTKPIKDVIPARPKDLADYWNYNLETVSRIHIQDTAKSLSASDYIDEAAKVFFLDQKGYNKLTKEQQRAWVKVGKLTKGEAEKAAAEHEAMGRVGRAVEAKIGSRKITKSRQLKYLGDTLERRPDLANKYVEVEIGNEILRYAKPFLQDPYDNPISRVMGPMKRFWISHTLPAWPAYFTRNKLGNYHNMNLAGWMDNPLYFAQDLADHVQASAAMAFIMKGDIKRAKAMKFYDKANDLTIDGYEAYKMFVKHGGSHSGFWSHEMESLFKTKTPWKSWKVWGNPLSTEFATTKGGRAAVKWMEEADKFTLFVNRLGKGDDYRTAAATAKKFLGDYRSVIMTPFEREFVSNTFWFYRWARFNVPLQAEQLLFSPKTRLKWASARRVHEHFIEPDPTTPGTVPEWTPEYIQKGSGVKTRYRDGKMEFFVLENWIPSADLGNILGPVAIGEYMIEQMNPIIGLFVGQATGVHPFFKEPLEKQAGEMWGTRMSGRMRHALHTMRAFWELDRLDPLGLAHKERELPSLESRLVRFFTGAKTYWSDPAMNIYHYRTKQQMAVRKETKRLESKKREKHIREWQGRVDELIVPGTPDWIEEGIKQALRYEQRWATEAGYETEEE